jgi:hypothetical protein
MGAAVDDAKSFLDMELTGLNAPEVATIALDKWPP